MDFEWIVSCISIKIYQPNNSYFKFAVPFEPRIRYLLKEVHAENV